MADFFLYLILGLTGAWLVNYLSDVLPVDRKLVPLRCDRCQSESGWRAYLAYGPCPSCGKKPSARHRVLLVGLPLLSVLMGFFPPPALGVALAILWLIYFALVVVIDVEHRLILHPVSLAGGLLGLLTGSLAHGIGNTLLGGAAGFAIMLVFYFLGEWFVRLLSRRREEEIQEVALGFGDVNLAGIMGTLLGWPGVLGGLITTILLGGMVSGVYLLIQVTRKKYQAFQALPYGPFLVFSTLCLLFLAGYV